MKSEKKPIIQEDVWINTQCRRCQSECGLRAHRVNGVVVKLEGIEGSSVGSQGGLCGKGLAGLQVLYDPNRLNTPLKRTNPKKGLGVDPQWKEIGWDEALDEIAGKLKKTMDEDPGKIVVQHGIINGMQQPSLFLVPMMVGLSSEKGHPIHINAAGSHCGNAGHFVNALNYSAFVIMPDWKYCKYVLVFGTNHSFGGFQQYSNKLAAEAHARGMKLVVFDPVCNNAASKADEWVPLIPGTDGIVALAMLHVIVNELGIYDAEYLKRKTNAPYLVGPDGHYVRDKATKKPLVWDAGASQAKTFDDEGMVDFALDGEYEVNGVKCRPVWPLLKNRFSEYTPEKAEPISGVPAATIRRIAGEYGRAAQVGSTIVIDGRQMPLRPVSTLNIRSAGTHRNGVHTLFAIDLLHHVLGAANVPGGCASIAVECHGHPDTGRPYIGVEACPDGFVKTAGKWPLPEHVWPLKKINRPQHDLSEMFPCALEVPVWNAANRDEVLKNANITPSPEVLVNYSTNAVMNGCNPADRASFYEKIPFIVDFDIWSNEFNEGFADIVLPDACYLEKSDWEGVECSFHTIAPGLDFPWSFHITQKVVEPMYGRRYAPEVIVDIFERMGLGHKVNMYFNGLLRLDESRKLKPTEKIVWEDLCDRAVTQTFGPEHNWEWFKEHGFVSWPKKLEEVYWKPFKDIRVQIYWEWMLGLKEETKKIAGEIGLAGDLAWEAFDPLPVWYPIVPHSVDNREFDLYAFSWAEAMHANTNTQEQPWLDEASKMNPFTYFVNINADTAKQKGLKSGDRVEVESWRGLKVQGILQTRKGQHPQTLTVMGVSGHWAKGKPISRGKGVHFNSLISLQLSDCDPISFNIEPTVKVKVRKIAHA